MYKVFFLFILLVIVSYCSEVKKDTKPDILKYEDYLKKEIHLPYVLDLKNEKKTFSLLWCCTFV